MSEQLPSSNPFREAQRRREERSRTGAEVPTTLQVAGTHEGNTNYSTRPDHLLESGRDETDVTDPVQSSENSSKANASARELNNRIEQVERGENG